MNGKKIFFSVLVIIIVLCAGLMYSVNPDIDLKDRIIEIVDKSGVTHLINKNDSKNEYNDGVDYSTPFETPIDFFDDEDDQTTSDNKKHGNTTDDKKEDTDASDKDENPDDKPSTPDEPQTPDRTEINKLPIDILE